MNVADQLRDLRLTELARKAWPELAEPGALNVVSDGDSITVWRDDGYELFTADHKRAPEALAVLAGESLEGWKL